MKILTTLNGTIETLGGYESKTHSFIRSKKLTMKGAERLVKMQNPKTTFQACSIEFSRMHEIVLGR